MSLFLKLVIELVRRGWMKLKPTDLSNLCGGGWEIMFSSRFLSLSFMMNPPDPMVQQWNQWRHQIVKENKRRSHFFSQRKWIWVFSSQCLTALHFLDGWGSGLCPQQMKGLESLSFFPKKASCLPHKQSLPPSEHLRKIRVLPHLHRARCWE